MKIDLKLIETIEVMSKINESIVFVAGHHVEVVDNFNTVFAIRNIDCDVNFHIPRADNFLTMLKCHVGKEAASENGHLVVKSHFGKTMVVGGSKGARYKNALKPTNTTWFTCGQFNEIKDGWDTLHNRVKFGRGSVVCSDGHDITTLFETVRAEGEESFMQVHASKLRNLPYAETLVQIDVDSRGAVSISYDDWTFIIAGDLQ